ncbi:MAG: glycosyltransferase family 2 protein [Candidatus Omnitrophica bacterium]|nr:glycosyltransferase family 2 protein [Candidatus Omnitrophota bacterium]
MSAPLVSVLVPTRDRIGFLKKSLATILNQTFHSIEILIGDNASTDGTAELCRQTAAADSRVRHLRSETPLSIYANHNRLIEQAQGDYLCFLHDDDEFDQTLLQEEVSFFNVHPLAGIVSPDWTLIDEEGKVLGTRDHAVPELEEGPAFIERTLRAGQSSVGLSGTMIRRAALLGTRFDESGPVGFGDFAFWFEISERASVGHIPKRLYFYRLHTRSHSRKSILSIAQDYQRALLTYCDNHLKRWPKHETLVSGWRHLINRYLFWLMAYSISLHFSKSGSNGKPASNGHTSGRYRTVLDLMDMRLTEAEFRELLAQFRSLRTGPVEAIARGAINFFVATRWTWPLQQLAPHAPAFRGILKLQ